MSHRFIRLTAPTTLVQRQREHAKPCDVEGCGRPRQIYQRLPGGLIRTRRWCRKHSKSRRRPLAYRTAPVSEPIPAHIKVHPCAIEECTGKCEVERAGRVLNGEVVAGWLVRSFCRRHRRPSQRPVGWLPGDGQELKRTTWQRRMKKFLGITKWQDRGWFGQDGSYHLRTGRALHVMDRHALIVLRSELTKEWKDRDPLGTFAARYNLAVVVVVGATLAIEEREGHE